MGRNGLHRHGQEITMTAGCREWGMLGELGEGGGKEGEQKRELIQKGEVHDGGKEEVCP